MNIKKFFIFTMLVLLVSSMLCACNIGSNLPSEGETEIETATLEVATKAEIGTLTENENIQNDTAQDSSSIYFVTEADDLEIMTAPRNDSEENTVSGGKGEDTPVTTAVVETQPDKDNNKQEETRIELPFISAN